MSDHAGLAPAKINLTLHVTGQRADGYHLLDSLVVFTEAGDRVTLRDGATLRLEVAGPQAADLAVEADNLVLGAARLMGVTQADILLEKHLPVASGMGGGSSDAATTLRLLARKTGRNLPDTAQAMTLGADLPVCLAAPAPARMRGLGERVDRVSHVPAMWVLLVNPGQGLSTPQVFRALKTRQNPAMPEDLPAWKDARDLCTWLRAQRNDLEAPARQLVPRIGQVLAELEAQAGCMLARMTGSGATCFGVFESHAQCAAAAQVLARPGWFVAPTRSFASALT